MITRLPIIAARPTLWLLGALACLAAPASVRTAQSSADVPRQYADIAGVYEFYLDQQYGVIEVSLDGGTLWMRAASASEKWALRPLDMAELRFRIDNPGSEHYAVFIRDASGAISSFRLVKDETVVGVRIPKGGRPPRPIESLFTVNELQDDLKQVRRILEEVHPAVHAFTDKQAFDRMYRKQLRQLDGPKTLAEFWQVAAPIVTAIGCGHTRVSFPTNYWAQAPPRFFPIRLKLIGDQAYVAASAEPAGALRPGSVVTAINGRRMRDIVRDLEALVPSDGWNDGSKALDISAGFAQLYAGRFGFPEQFVVQGAPPGGRKAEVRLRAVERARIPSDPFVARSSTSSGDPNLDFKVLPDGGGTAVLTIRNFDYYNAQDKFRGFIDESFARIREAGIRRLVLDLRGNGGGDPFCTTHLLSYLEPSPVPYFARVYPSPYGPFAEPIPRAATPFEGKLFVLIDAGCFSSTGHLCALLKYHKIGTFIGTETEGTYECNDARRVGGYDLKNTRLRLAVPRMTFTAAVKDMPRYRGVMPDIPVEPSMSDYLSGTDPVLERALALCASSGADRFSWSAVSESVPHAGLRR